MSDGRGTTHSVEELEQALSDESEWETPRRSQKKSERRQRGAMVSVRLTPAELEVVQERAQERGLSVGAYMREQALGTGARVLEPAACVGAVVYSVTASTRSELNARAHLPSMFERWQSSADQLVDH